VVRVAIPQIDECFQGRRAAEFRPPAMHGARPPAHVVRFGGMTPRPIGERVAVELVQVLRELGLPDASSWHVPAARTIRASSATAVARCSWVRGSRCVSSTARSVRAASG
jgi:hypothetical protein